MIAQVCTDLASFSSASLDCWFIRKRLSVLHRPRLFSPCLVISIATAVGGVMSRGKGIPGESSDLACFYFRMEAVLVYQDAP